MGTLKASGKWKKLERNHLTSLRDLYGAKSILKNNNTLKMYNVYLIELYHLLTNHYVEDDDNTFRFDYSRGFLQWALTPPGYQPKWLVGVRNVKT